MDPFDYGKALADFWAMGSKALLGAQESTARAFADGLRTAAAGTCTLPLFPGMPELGADMGELMRVTQSIADLWTAASSLSGTLATRLPGPAGQMGTAVDPTVEATFRKMADPRAWLTATGEMDELLSRLSEGPQLADLWDVERKYARVFQAWINLRRRSLEHAGVVLEAWLRAGRTFAARIAERPKDRPPLNGRAALDFWIETANQTLIETQRSEAFLRTQAALIRAGPDLRLAQRELVEYYGERFGFPTRTELDDVHRTVTELRRELRALRRERRAGTAETERGQPAQAGSRKPRHIDQNRGEAARSEPQAMDAVSAGGPQTTPQTTGS